MARKKRKPRNKRIPKERGRPATKLERMVYNFVCDNPGADVVDVAKHFNLSLVEADTVIQGLLVAGVLEFEVLE